MKPITSGALDLLDRVLGLPKGGVQTPQLDDGNVVINLPLGPDIVRRSRTLGGSTGWFFGLLRTVQAGAGDETAEIDPYNTGTAVPPYVDPLPAGMEIWLHGASVETTLGGAVDNALLEIDPTANMQAFGANQAGGALLANPGITLANWDSAPVSGVSGMSVPLLTPDGNPWVPINIRIPRGAILRFGVDANDATTNTCVLLLGVFPVSLGSDVAK